MVRWSLPNARHFISPAIRWQSRAEILKKHLDTLSPEELRQVRPDYYWLRFGHDAWKRQQARKYDPHQPRVLAGNPDGGQWTSGGGSSDRTGSTRRQPAPYTLASSGRQSAAYCWNQMQIDMLYCTTLPRTIIAACRAQAMERYSACLAGKRLPPLSF